jgi:O-methyltransferase involved in polyketide biosynthesis
MDMSDDSVQDLSEVAETLLIPLYMRAMESKRPNALIKDEKAVALVQRLDYDFSRSSSRIMTRWASSCGLDDALRTLWQMAQPDPRTGEQNAALDQLQTAAN